MYNYYGSTGQKGEDCGNINIFNNLSVYAYGGTGGSGGGCSFDPHDGELPHQSGGGGGGFPRSWNRRWPELVGCSGDTNCSGAGYSAGQGEYLQEDIGAVNGETLSKLQSASCKGIGGSYYESYANFNTTTVIHKNLYDYSVISKKGIVFSGGIGGGSGSSLDEFYGKDRKPIDSAQAGKGGNITVSKNAKIYAYNGSYITTKNSSEMTINERQSTQALIYAQAGYDVKSIRELLKVKVVNSRTIEDLVKEWSLPDFDFTEQRIIKSPYDSSCGKKENKFILGIGSGAGGLQDIDGNGIYSIDENLN